MNVKIDFASQEEEDWFIGSFVALSSIDGRLMRDSRREPYWAEDEEELELMLKENDYNNFGIAFVEDPEDFYDDDLDFEFYNS